MLSWIYGIMHLCNYAFMQLCNSAFMHLDFTVFFTMKYPLESTWSSSRPLQDCTSVLYLGRHSKVTEKSSGPSTPSYGVP